MDDLSGVPLMGHQERWTCKEWQLGHGKLRRTEHTGRPGWVLESHKYWWYICMQVPVLMTDEEKRCWNS